MSQRSIIYYLRIVRPKNLLIVAISQALIYLVYLFPVRTLTTLALDGSLWILFILDTLLIAAGGYVVNDIMDQKADAFNKPEKICIGQGGISIQCG